MPFISYSPRLLKNLGYIKVRSITFLMADHSPPCVGVGRLHGFHFLVVHADEVLLVLLVVSLQILNGRPNDVWVCVGVELRSMVNVTSSV